MMKQMWIDVPEQAVHVQVGHQCPCNEGKVLSCDRKVARMTCTAGEHRLPLLTFRVVLEGVERVK